MVVDPEPDERHKADDRFHQLVDSIEDYAIYLLDCGGHVITWNPGAERNKGYRSEEVLGKHFRMFFVPEDILSKAPEQELLEALRCGRCAGEGWRLRKDGARFWASFVITTVHDASGQWTGYAKVTRDLTERKQQQDAMLAMEAALREERDLLRGAAESSMDALYICQAVRDAKGEIEDFIFVYLNSNVEKMVSVPCGAILGKRMCTFLPFNRTLGLFERYREVVLSGKPLAYEFPVDGDGINCTWIRVQAVKLRDGLAITASDISLRKLDEKRIFHLAHHDPLTGLPNRSLLYDRIEQAVERAKRYGGKIAVLIIDLDCFKQINDTHGHAAGDAVLVATGARLTATIRAIDSVIRIGGDEFVVVLPEIARRDDILLCAEKILESLRQPIESGNRPMRISCSIGIAIYPGADADTVDDLLRCADSAMYAAKGRGKDKMEVFSPPLSLQSSRG
jgi:diguanylate cyclase (GGDEF)-like protein/PAS domain S-box-containing protein